MSWPFGVELLCLVVIRALMLLSQLAGNSVAAATAAAILAACLERRRQHGPKTGALRLGGHRAWHIAHVSLVSHRLPICLTAMLLTLMLRIVQLPGQGFAFADDRLQQAATACLLAAAWAAAAFGIVVTTALEWCWTFGPRELIPWWLYPFPIKLPLVFGCVLLLEISRRCASSAAGPPSKINSSGASDARQAGGSRSATEIVLELLERRSLGVLVMHEFVEFVVVHNLHPHKRTLAMFWFELPAVLVWSYIVASVFVWSRSLSVLSSTAQSIRYAGHRQFRAACPPSLRLSWLPR